MRRLLVVAVALASAGCVQAEDLVEAQAARWRLLGERGVAAWEETREASMAPTFDGEGPAYPVLLLHQHHLPSERQREEARKNPIVCLDAEGAPLTFARNSRGAREVAMTAPCLGPPADPATGRAFVDPKEYRARGAVGLALRMDACEGGGILLTPQEPSFLVAAPGHTFRVTVLPNGTFDVDGRWIEPGTSLKVAYTLAGDGPREEESVRVVFDAPGVWLHARMGGEGTDLGPDVPPRPWEGTGLVTAVPIAPAHLAEALERAVAATPGGVDAVLGVRAVHDGRRMTELTARFLTPSGVVTWYGAGRVGDRMTLLGAESAHEDAPGTPRERALALGTIPWGELRASDEPGFADVRLDPTVRWTSGGLPPVGMDRTLPGGDCEEGCVLVRHDARWERMLMPMPQAAADAATLRVLTEPDQREVWWHVP